MRENRPPHTLLLNNFSFIVGHLPSRFTKSVMDNNVKKVDSKNDTRFSSAVNQKMSNCVGNSYHNKYIICCYK